MSTTPTTTQPELLDAHTVAELLSCSVRHVERMNSAGKLPQALHVGRLRRWRRVELLGWLDAGCPDRRTWAGLREGRAKP